MMPVHGGPPPSGAPLQVVPITEALSAGFRACLDAVARERRFLAQVEAPPLERVQEFVRDGLEKGAVQFVALDGERVVGWADIFADWAHAVSHRGHVGMGVHADFRGRGLGTRLLGACLAKATEQGLSRIELEVRADNTHAIALYRKLGFVEEGRLRHGMRFDGAFFDTLLMARVADERGA